MNKYTLIRDANIAIKQAELSNNLTGLTALLLVGEPGTGKNYWVEEILNKIWTNSVLIIKQCTPYLNEDDLYVDLNVNVAIDRATGVKTNDEIYQKGVLIEALERSKTERVILLIDELDKVPELSIYLLDFLQKARVNKLPFAMVQGIFKNLIVVITSNGERNFTNALYRRVTTINLTYPSKQEQYDRIIFTYPRVVEYFNKSVIMSFIDLQTEIRMNEDMLYKPVYTELGNMLEQLHIINAKESSSEVLLKFISSRLSNRIEDQTTILNTTSLKQLLTKSISLCIKKIVNNVKQC